MTRRWKIFTIVGLLAMLADQVTKIMARAWLPIYEHANIDPPPGKPVVVIENFFDWRLSHNPGSAFGLFNDTAGSRIFLSIIGVIAVGAIFWMLHKAREDQVRLTWALGLVAGGAIGNLIDRIGFGVVTDFIVWKYYEREWPTFNVADVALVIGVGLLFLDIGKEAKEEARATKEERNRSKGKSGKPEPSSKVKAKSKADSAPASRAPSKASGKKRASE